MRQFRRSVRFAVLGWTTALAVSVAEAQTTPQYSHPDVPQVRLNDGRIVNNPVAESGGRVNPRVPATGQGDGNYGWVRTRRNEDGQVVPRMHYGHDYPAPVGTPVRSPVLGQVVRSESGRSTVPSQGNEVRVRDVYGYEHRLWHLNGGNQPAVGTWVEEGQVVGEVGRTGNVPARATPHLHYEVRERDGSPVPVESLPARAPEGSFESYRESLSRIPPTNSGDTTGARIEHDDNAPRRARAEPAVTPRRPGANAQTASLRRPF